MEDRNYKVYVHISPSSKRYYGVTCQEVKDRWKNGKGYSNNKHFTNAINKYGWDNIEHIVIAKGLTKEEADWLEIELIREFDTTNQDKGYNVTKGGKSANGLCGELNGMYGVHRYGELNPMYGKTHTEEAKKKNSEAHKGKIHTEETRKKMSENQSGKNNGRATSVICLTTNRIFHTRNEGAEYYNIKSANGISKCCKGNQKSAGKLLNGTPLVWRRITWQHNKTYRIVRNNKEVA